MQAMRLRMVLLATKFSLTVAHNATAFLTLKLQGIEMNLSDRLKQIGDIIATGAPHLAAAAAEAEQAVATLAPAIVDAIPSTANAASNVENAVHMAQAVTTAAAAIVSTPVVDIASALNGTPDEQAGTMAAAGVSAQATATAAAHETRLQIIESTIVELLPAVASLLRMFGK